MPTRSWEVEVMRGKNQWDPASFRKTYTVTGKTTPTALHRGAAAHIKAGFRIREDDRLSVRRASEKKPARRKKRGT